MYVGSCCLAMVAVDVVEAWIGVAVMDQRWSSLFCKMMMKSVRDFCFNFLSFLKKWGYVLTAKSFIFAYFDICFGPNVIKPFLFANYTCQL
jgi:hypothetical protein